MIRSGKRLAASLLLVFLVLTSIPSIAETVTPQSILVPQVEYIWAQVGSPQDKGLVYRGNDWVEFYTGYPATAAGEKDTGSYTVKYKHEFEGQLKIGKGPVEAQLKITFGYEETFSASKTSRELAKGEYVKMEYRKTWRAYKIDQKQIKHTYGWTYDANSQAVYINTYEDTGVTAIAVAYKALLPQLRLTYYQK